MPCRAVMPATRGHDIKCRSVPTTATPPGTRADNNKQPLTLCADGASGRLAKSDTTQPEVRRLGGIADERSLRHFGIGFDEYDTFDMVALGVDIEEFSEIRSLRPG